MPRMLVMEENLVMKLSDKCTEISLPPQSGKTVESIVKPPGMIQLVVGSDMSAWSSYHVSTA